MKYTWHLGWQTWLSLLALGVALWTVISYANLMMEIIWILFGAFLLSLAIRPLADRLTRRRVPRSLTVLAVDKVTVGPNPFNDSLTIFLGRDPSGLKNIAIFSSGGEKVWDNFSDTYKDGAGTVVWHGVNNSGKEVAAGVYFILVETEEVSHRINVFKK